MPRIERPFWVIEQLEVALSEGLGGRLRKAIKHWRHITGLPPGTGPRPSASVQLVEDACAAAGVELGAYDREVVASLADCEPWVAVAFAGLICRAHATALAARSVLGDGHEAASAFSWSMCSRKIRRSRPIQT